MSIMYLNNYQNVKYLFTVLTTGSTSVPYTATCFSESFNVHGPRTESVHVYMILDSYNIKECHWNCKNDETCLGYTYYDDLQRCVLSNDTVFIDSSPCFSCRFYEKACHSCMYSFLYIKKKLRCARVLCSINMEFCVK